MLVRPAAESDVPTILDMMEDFNHHEQIAWQRGPGEAPLRALIGDPGLGLVCLGEQDGAAVGYAIVTWGFDLEWAGRDCFLTELYVRPERRGAQLGARLLEQATALAREAGARAIHLVVRHDNPTARALYERAGFEAIPRTLMTRRLA